MQLNQHQVSSPNEEELKLNHEQVLNFLVNSTVINKYIGNDNHIQKLTLVPAYRFYYSFDRVTVKMVKRSKTEKMFELGGFQDGA